MVRRYLLDVALALTLAAASLLSGATLFFGSPAAQKLVMMYGSDTAWHQASLVWGLLTIPCAAGLAVQHRWPRLAVVLAGIGAGGHLLNPRIGPLLVDLAAPITLYTLATLDRFRRACWVAVVAMSAAAYLLTLTGQVMVDRLAVPGLGPKTVLTGPTTRPAWSRPAMLSR